MALTDKLFNIGEAIRKKLGSNELIPLADMPDKIDGVYEAGGKVKKTSDKAKEFTIDNITTDTKIVSLTLDLLSGWNTSRGYRGILFYNKNMLAIDDFAVTGNGITRAAVPFELEGVFAENQQYTLSWYFYRENAKYSETGRLLYVKVTYTDGSYEYTAIKQNTAQGRLVFTTAKGKTVRRIENFMAHQRWTGGTIYVWGVQLEKGATATTYSPIKSQFVKIPHVFKSTYVMENGRVIRTWAGNTSDETDTEFGQQLLTLHVLEGRTNVICSVDCQITYETDKTSLAKREVISGVVKDSTDFAYLCYRGRLANLIHYEDTSTGHGFTGMFSQYPYEVSPRIDTSTGNYFSSMFVGASNLVDIPILDFSNATHISGTFQACKNLVNLGVVGQIGCSGLNVSHCKKLSKESIIRIITSLSPSTSGKSVTISKEAKDAAFTDSEWATLIATKTNWTINLA